MFLLLYWPTYADAGADNLWSLFYYTEKPSWNLSYWNNDTFNSTVDKASRDQRSNDCSAPVLEAMNILVDEAPGVFFFDT